MLLRVKNKDWKLPPIAVAITASLRKGQSFAFFFLCCCKFLSGFTICFSRRHTIICRLTSLLILLSLQVGLECKLFVGWEDEVIPSLEYKKEFERKNSWWMNSSMLQFWPVVFEQDFVSKPLNEMPCLQPPLSVG